MSAVSFREKNMLLITVVLVLYAVAALSYKKQTAKWRVAQRIHYTARKKLAEQRDLIAARASWEAKYDRMRELMPVFPYDKDVDTHWLNLMDATATRNGFTIQRRQTNKELEVGDVFELPIECRDWEAPLEALVKFLHALQQEGAMLDIRQLYIRPSNKPGLLKGTFTLTCAYMRRDDALPQTMPAVGDTQSETGASATSGKTAIVSEIEAGGTEEAQKPPVVAPAATNGVLPDK